jgi:hypothetical protein
VAIYNVDLSVTQNEDRSWVFGFASADPGGNLALATPFSFTGCTAKMQIRVSPDTSQPALLSLATGGAGITLGGPTTLSGVSCGTITISLTHGQTASLPEGELFYDCLVTTASGAQAYYLQGAFPVCASGTR